MPWQPELPFAGEKPLAENEIPRTIALGDRIVPYILRRARRRTIGLTIDHRGLRVGAPHRAAFAEVESLIRKHGDWVTQKLDEWHNRRRPAPRRITDGANLPYLGTTVTLQLTCGDDQTLWDESGKPRLTLALSSPSQAEQLLERALKEKALSFFKQRIACFAGQFGLPIPKLSLTAARTRWGSCSLKTGIRLNWRLVHQRQELIDYVVIHELAHLREMNHSARFWAIVGQYCPDYRQLRRELKTLST